MFKVAREVPTFTRGRIVRAGRRIRVAELDVVQFGVASTADSNAGDSSAEEVVVARATAVFLRTSANPPGTRWRRPDEAVTFRPPTEPIGDSDVMSRFSSDVPEAGVPEADAPDAAGASNGAWNTDMGAHQNGGRKRLLSLIHI